jgi:hypothetical protein
MAVHRAKKPEFGIASVSVFSDTRNTHLNFDIKTFQSCVNALRHVCPAEGEKVCVMHQKWRMKYNKIKII